MGVAFSQILSACGILGGRVACGRAYARQLHLFVPSTTAGASTAIPYLHLPKLLLLSPSYWSAPVHLTRTNPCLFRPLDDNGGSWELIGTSWNNENL